MSPNLPIVEHALQTILISATSKQRIIKHTIAKKDDAKATPQFGSLTLHRKSASPVHSKKHD